MTLPEQQLEMIRRMAALDPAPYFMGGYAEDALLAGSVTRPHLDIDWVLPRSELRLRRAQAEELGFSGFETFGEAAPGVPFYLFAEAGEVRLDLGIADEEDDTLWLRVHRLVFEVDGGEAPAGYCFRLPEDTFAYPLVELDGTSIRVASPLALYQIRVGIAAQGSFGELSDRQQASARRLRERFLAAVPEEELAPRIEKLDS